MNEKELDMGTGFCAGHRPFAGASLLTYAFYFLALRAKHHQISYKSRGVGLRLAPINNNS
jgi:hypothetical protein